MKMKSQTKIKPPLRLLTPRFQRVSRSGEDPSTTTTISMVPIRNQHVVLTAMLLDSSEDKRSSDAAHETRHDPARRPLVPVSSSTTNFRHHRTRTRVSVRPSKTSQLVIENGRIPSRRRREDRVHRPRRFFARRTPAAEEPSHARLGVDERHTQVREEARHSREDTTSLLIIFKHRGRHCHRRHRWRSGDKSRWNSQRRGNRDFSYSVRDWYEEERAQELERAGTDDLVAQCK